MKTANIRLLAYYALFIAIIFILGLTPLGFIYLPIAAITMVHIPVIIGGFQLGVKGGALLGFFFGLMSLIKSFMAPDATSAVLHGTHTGFGLYNLFLILAITFFPRVLMGMVSASTYKLIRKWDKRGFIAMAVAAVLGTLTNTVFYLGGLYLFAHDAAAAMMGVAGEQLLGALLGIVSLNGVLEVIAAVVICVPVGQALRFLTEKKHTKGEA